ncbi:PREDICTED: uncharacterized protein LOC108556579 [Nicrophorus vespilloides]|uniref:Uncharacterized protein LOC108556579 n=1 Tax=Nicrophorus vespilloides TaxID=110193 RepID=A0ABM1M0Y9_NICVS|nr:PREDICTED: uncharacterized protein LOC108556579 [Nicrophorus vespilloides]
MASNMSQGAYAPLPQSLSDSDSEKETSDHNRLSFTARKLQNGNETRNGYPVPPHVVNLSRREGFTNMTRARKVAFIASILLCFLVIVVFLWILPCNSEGTCPMRLNSWKNEHEGLEFKGKINIVHGLYKNSLNMVLLGKKSIVSENQQSGTVAIKVIDGDLAWFVPQIQMPNTVDCEMIDLNGDNIKDCLILSKIGLEAVDSVSGEKIWNLHNEKMIISNVDFPQLLPDLNNDGTNEMITVAEKSPNHNRLIVFSGLTGKMLLNIVLKSCINISDFKFVDNYFIYFCTNASFKNYFKIHFSEFQTKYVNNTYTVKSAKIDYHPEYKDDVILNGRSLFVKNEGKCPNCRASLDLVNHSSKVPIWTKTLEKTFAMRPVTFSFKGTQNYQALKGHMNGFILKLWSWNHSNITAQNNVSEKIVLITFNDTNVHEINVSYSQITQICLKDGQCQPDFSDENDSLMINDLDLDGELELISYSSGFKCPRESIETCKLISSIEVVRLEGELPKLYASK